MAVVMRDGDVGVRDSLVDNEIGDVGAVTCTGWRNMMVVMRDGDVGVRDSLVEDEIGDVEAVTCTWVARCCYRRCGARYPFRT